MTRSTLREVLEQLCDELRPLVRERGLAFALDVVDRRQRHRRRVRLRQTFANLLSNAIKFSPPGGRVDVHARYDEPEAVVEVADEGPGIPPEELSRISSASFAPRPRRASRAPALG